MWFSIILVRPSPAALFCKNRKKKRLRAFDEKLFFFSQNVGVNQKTYRNQLKFYTDGSALNGIGFTPEERCHNI